MVVYRINVLGYAEGSIDIYQVGRFVASERHAIMNQISSSRCDSEVGSAIRVRTRAASDGKSAKTVSAWTPASPQYWQRKVRKFYEQFRNEVMSSGSRTVDDQTCVNLDRLRGLGYTQRMLADRLLAACVVPRGRQWFQNRSGWSACDVLKRCKNLNQWIVSSRST